MQARRLATPILTALLLLPAAAGAQGRPSPTVFSGAPSASWIAPPGVPADSFTVFHARRVVELRERPEHFVVHVSADNRYRLYVNGEEVSSGPQRSDVTHWRYETVDLAPRLRPGRNVIAALVWNWGATRPVAQHSYRTGFLLQGDPRARRRWSTPARGGSCRWTPPTRRSPSPPRQVGGYYAAVARRVAWTARAIPWGWERADYPDDDWYTVPKPARRRCSGGCSCVPLPGHARARARWWAGSWSRASCRRWRRRRSACPGCGARRG